MPMMKNVLGLDLGSHAIKAVELRQTLRGLEPVQMRLHEAGDGPEAGAESLGHLLASHAFASDHVACALAGDRVSMRRLEFPFRDRKRLVAAVPFEVESGIPFDLADVVIDWQLLEGQRTHGVVAAAIAQRADVATLLELLGEAGCEPRVVEAEGLVLANLATLFDLPGVRLLVDIGHRKTTLCLVRDGQPLTARTLPGGGHAVTLAMVREMGLTPEAAEARKCEQGLFELGWNSPSPTAVSQLDRIAREILRTLESQEATLGGDAISVVDEITLMGGGSRLQRIDAFLAERTGVPTRHLAPPEDAEAAALVAGGDPVLFGPAIALALRSTANATTQIDFRRDEFAYKSDFGWVFGPQLRPTAILAGLLLLLLGISTTGSIAVESHKAEQLEQQAGAIYSDLFPGQAIPERPMATLTRAVTEARDRADFLGLYGGNLSALDLMTRLSALIPDEIKLKFDEVAIDREVIRIKVMTDSYESMDRLENELRTEPAFAGVDVSGQAKRQRDGSVTFNLSIPLETRGESS